MKQVAKSLVIVGAMLAAGSAAADMDDFSVRPFVGFDVSQTWMEGKGTLANTNVRNHRIFRKTYPGATVYVGTKFTDCFGIELGADWSSSKKRTVTDSTTVAGSSFTLSQKVRREGYHADLVGFLPMDCWELFGSLGVGSVKLKLSDRTESSTGAAATFNNQFPLSVKRKTVARVGIGANYMVTDCVGLRIKAGWENTERLRLKYFNNVVPHQKAFKNSTTLAVGAFYRW